MTSIFDRLLQDPVIFSSAIVLLASLAFFFWLLSKLQHEHTESPIAPHEEQTPKVSTPVEKVVPEEISGLSEARLKEISTMLVDISQRLTSIEKSLSTTSANQTETLITRLSPLLKDQQAAASGVDLSEIETKLNGIHKLLIILTDSGSTNDR